MTDLVRGTAPWTFVPLGIFPFLVELSLKAAIVVGLAALVNVALGRRSAAARHLVWSGTFAAMLLLPVVATVAPDWRIVPVPWMPTTPSIGIRVVQANGSPHLHGANGYWTRGLASVWLLGLLAIVIRYGVGTMGVRRWTRTSEPLLGDEWFAAVESARSSIGAVRAPRLFETTATTVPLVWGWREPLVFLPPSARSWNAECRSMVLAHELAHMKRADVMTEALVQVVCAVFWFHPAVWYAARRLRLERERACDSIVLLGGAKPSVYARYLMAVVEGAHPQASPVIAALGMVQPRDLSRRMMALLDARTVHGEPSRRVRVLSVGALATCSVLLGPVALRTPVLRGSVPKKASLVFEQPEGASSPRLIFAGTDAEARRLIDSLRRVRAHR